MNIIYLSARSRWSRLDRVDRIVRDKDCVGTLADGRQCWRGTIKLNNRVYIVETIGSQDESVWYRVFFKFNRWRQCHDGEWIHEEDWNHYSDNAWNGKIKIIEANNA